MFEKGRGVSADLDQASTLYRKACDDGDATGCSNLGAMYASGKAKPNAAAGTTTKPVASGGAK
jgi:TPR repeat protein